MPSSQTVLGLGDLVLCPRAPHQFQAHPYVQQAMLPPTRTSEIRLNAYTSDPAYKLSLRWCGMRGGGVLERSAAASVGLYYEYQYGVIDRCRL